MKKTFVFIISLMILLTSVAYAVDLNNNILVTFDSGSSYLNISGVISSSVNEPVTMVVAKSDANKTFSPSDTPDIMLLYMTDQNGMLRINEKISSSFSGGKYDVILTGKNWKKDDFSFIFMNPSDPDTIDLIASINSLAESSELKSLVMSDDNAAKLGIDIEVTHIGTYIEDVLEDILDCKALLEGETFTPESFLDMFSKLVAIKMTNDGYVTEAMLNYASYFGTTSEKYNTDNVQTNSEFETLLKDAEFTVSNLDTIYDELLLVSKIKSAENWSYMQDIIFGNSDELGISTDDYESIKETSRYKVFTKMFDQRGTFSDIDDVLAAFDDAVDSIKKKESSQAGSSGGSGGGGGSGSGGGKDNSNSVKVPSGPAPVVVTPEKPSHISFNDIKGHFAEEYILTLAGESIINGYGNGNFLPDGKITRAEFSKIIAVRFGIDENADIQYGDISDSDWYAPYIKSLSGAKIINGYDGIFNPNALISRQDAAVICMRVAKYFSKSMNGSTPFADSENISDYAKDAVAALGANGIINGDGEKFRPKDGITRGETAAIICRLFDVINQEEFE